MTKRQRTRINDREELKRRYVDAAERIITEEGFGAVTARRLAGQIGVAVGTTYNLFANLEEIAVAVNARTLDRLAEAATSAPLPGMTVEADLMTLASRYLSFVRSNRNLWLALFELDLAVGPETLFPNQPRFEALFGLVETVLDPLFDPDDTEDRARSARVLWAGLHGISMLSLGGRLSPLGVQEAEDLVETLITCHVAGLRAQA